MPFATTALVNNGGDELINHFAGVKLRLNGVGDLLMTVYSFDESKSSVLLPLTMSNTPGREPTRLMNFMTQRIKIKFTTDMIDEVVKINRVLLYARPTYAEYPQ